MTAETAIKILSLDRRNDERIIEGTSKYALKKMPILVNHFEAYNMAIEALEQVEEYRALGTVEELKKVKGKQIKKKPLYYTFGKEKYPKCPFCGDNWNMDEYGSGMVYCWECGQAIDWSEE